jgi:UDP-N-acetylmuramyl-tripeptide synthetase
MAPHTLAAVPDALAWLRARDVHALATDSRRLRPGDAFIAWPGHVSDGRQYVMQALEAGAHACIVEAQGVEAFGFHDDAIAALADLKARTGELAAAFHDAPSAALEVIATTGTNGKTSTAWWTAQALCLLGRRCGVVGTLGIGEPPRGRAAGGQPAVGDDRGDVVATGLTTPDPVELQAAFRRFVDTGFSACAIEASSIGLVDHRLAGTHIAVALFTNLTQDHLDYHGTMAAYGEAKRRLFDWPGLRAAVLNLDDPFGAELAGHVRDRALDVWTYSTGRDARIAARAIAYRDGGLGFELHEGSEVVPVRSTLIGSYNVSNLLAVIGGLRALGVPLKAIAAVVPQLTAVPGRMQRVPADRPGPQVVVDYAHTPDALEKALLALQPFAAERAGMLWCVFGCGGDRDPIKRPLMGAIAQRLARRVVVTSDNPRHETPGFILQQIVGGLVDGAQPVSVIEDRRAAIRHAVAGADARDVILIAGKGHEDYQEIAGKRYPFSDIDEAGAALELRP